MSYTSKFTGEEIDQLLEEVKNSESSVSGVAGDYGEFIIDDNEVSVIKELKPAKVRGTLEINENGRIQLNPNKTYLIIFNPYHIQFSSSAGFCYQSCYFSNDPETRLLVHSTFALDTTTTYSDTNFERTIGTTIIATTDENNELYFTNSSYYVDGSVGSKTTAIQDTIIIVELGATSSNSRSSTPIGSILPVMGTEAPQDYLICDGSELNIVEYKELANYFEKQFGSKNYFGGDGTTTFAIPDLRNEFLRGYHCDGELQLSGEIGIHQDATEHPEVWSWNSNSSSSTVSINLRNTTASTTGNRSYNEDTEIQTIVGRTTANLTGNITNNANDMCEAYTSRPTNVAVLFCIKYTEDTSGEASEENYSTSEQKIGTWIDGKPLYRKIYKFDITSTPTRQTIIFDKDFGVDKEMKRIDGNVFTQVNGWKGSYKLGLFDWHNNANQFFFFLPNMENNDLVLSTQWSVTQDFTVEAIVEYTKLTD